MQNKIKLLALFLVAHASSKGKIFISDNPPIVSRLVCGSETERAEEIKNINKELLASGFDGNNSLLLDEPMQDARDTGQECHLIKTFQITKDGKNNNYLFLRR